MLEEPRAAVREGVDPSLLKAEEGLLWKLNDAEQTHSKLLRERHTSDDVAALQLKLNNLNSEYKILQEKIRAASPRYASLTRVAPTSLRQIQEQLLAPDTLLLEYALGDERSFLWAITQSRVDIFILPPRKEIEALALDVYGLLSNPRSSPVLEAEYRIKAQKLSRMTVGPVSGLLNKKRILVVADGALQYVPFFALPVPQETPGTSRSETVPILFEHEVVSLPSASTLALIRKEVEGRRPAPKSVAVLADPVFDRKDPRPNDLGQGPSPKVSGNVVEKLEKALRGAAGADDVMDLPPLAATRDEADAIMKLVPNPTDRLIATDFRANLQTAKSPELSQYRIIHLATHGLFDSSHPERSGLVFSTFDTQREPINGVLRLRDIYNLNLPAELVVLSACNTALGKEVKGEGLIGLTRGFMYAGAARVVSSLWKVDDTASAELMTRFYSKMLKENLSPASALRSAQLDLLKVRAWRSPHFWAAFVLQGEWH